MSPNVPFHDIPYSVLDDVRLGIQHYFAPLLVLSPDHPKHPVDFAGSGTLVELAGRHYILTADHVWNETKGWDEIGLVVAAEGVPLRIPRDRILTKRLRARRYSQWGPDLALLEIPVDLVGPIRARKSFLNLARRRSRLLSHPLQMEKGLWAVMGLVGQSSRLEAVSEKRVVVANLRGEAFFGATCKLNTRNEYDYLTICAKTTLPGVPSSFKGVSGGGLWQVTLKLKAQTIVWAGELDFRGVAFWEKPQPPDQVAIRCHGPRSIFQKAWGVWGLSRVIGSAKRGQARA